MWGGGASGFLIEKLGILGGCLEVLPSCPGVSIGFR